MYLWSTVYYVFIYGEIMIISVAGNISSGKTTLAKKISSLYGFTYIPYQRNELSFLDDFFNDIPKFFFATQTSFLVNKVAEIDEKRRTNNIVIDRSLYEDINIFAQLWMENYSIDEKEKVLYKDLADYLISTIPPTDIYIYCNCERKTQLERFSKRAKRSFENSYPIDYIQQLCDKYESIVFPDNAVVVELDTANLDVRDDNTVINIMSYILYHVNYRQAEQLSLFGDSGDIEKTVETNPYINIIQNPNSSIFPDDIFSIKKKIIYLAAPFTEFATIEPIQNNDDQLTVEVNLERDYNVLPDNYQRFLRKIKKLLSSDGQYDVILPHKDENDWGKTYISNTQIVEAMINNMKNSDLLVAVVSDSIGVHMELAMMSIQNKPMILVIVDDLTSGFYAEGFKLYDNALILHSKSIDNVYKILNTNDVKDFIRRKLEDEKMDSK